MIRILLADDHAMFREGLRRILELETGFEIVGEAKDGIEVVELQQIGTSIRCASKRHCLRSNGRMRLNNGNDMRD